MAGKPWFMVFSAGGSVQAAMAERRNIRFEEITLTRYHPSGPEAVGTLGWDSKRRRVWGSLAQAVQAVAAQATRDRYVLIRGPVPSVIRHKITDPLRKPNELAALISSLDYFVPEILLPYYHPPKVGMDFKKSDIKRLGARGGNIVY